MASRPRSWADSRFAGTSLVAGTPRQDNLLLNAPVSDTLTVVRVIGHLTVRYLVNTTVGDAQSAVDLGIGVSSEEAFDLLAGTGLPDISNDSKYPPRGWIYAATRSVTQILDAAGGVSITDREAVFNFDIRAMRKIDKGILFMIMEQNNIIVGGAMNITGRVRVLCLT